jgi:amino acid adenylation domain-containing protein
MSSDPRANLADVSDRASYLGRQHVCVHHLIADQAAKNPNAIALVSGRRKCTYAQLNANANQLAQFLREKGVGPETRTALCIKPSVEMVVAMLGILKAGGAYVPINPNDPPERQSFQLHDAGAMVLVTTDKLGKILPLDGRQIVRLDTDWPAIAGSSQVNPDGGAIPENPAYVIYTSGSTGRPKGVVITHSGLLNYLSWASKAYGNEARRSALVHSSISFDLTVTGLFTPLIVGGRVELLPHEEGIDALVEALRRPESRGLVKITPAHLELLSHMLRPEEAARKVDLFVIGGENLTADSLRFWRQVSPATRLINEYGPTETVVGCCVYEVQADDPFTGFVPIGKAIDNTQLYILDTALKPVDVGVTGELYIGGAGVARGYLDRPELTDAHFVADPFSGDPLARMYKTGDLARVRNDGSLECLGRIDDQVKIRGFRVELGEIEAVVTEHAAVRQCAALAQEDGSGGKLLVAYVTERAGQTIVPLNLREFLKRKLPEYMVPAHVVVTDAFPLTSNGKVDRRALAALARTLTREEFVAPQNSAEFKLAAIWTELFEIDPISVTDNFFDLGGHSLLVARLLAKIESSFEQRLSMATVFQAPTIRELAATLANPVRSTPQVIPIKSTGSLPPFFCIGAGPLFRALAYKLEPERPFLSLMPSLISIENRPLDRLEKIAASLVECIIDHQGTGPYYIGGWSASGVVAYEIAQQLMTKGHKVNLLALFDTLNPAFQQNLSNKVWLDSWTKKIKFSAAELVGLKLREMPDYVTQKLKSIHWRVRHRIRLQRNVISQDAAENFRLAVDHYRPSPYPGPLVFFEAATTCPGKSWDFASGWRNLVHGAFVVHEVPGDHESMFKEPNVQTLANDLMNYFHVEKTGEATFAESDAADVGSRAIRNSRSVGSCSS